MRITRRLFIFRKLLNSGYFPSKFRILQDVAYFFPFLAFKSDRVEVLNDFDFSSPSPQHRNEQQGRLLLLPRQEGQIWQRAAWEKVHWSGWWERPGIPWHRRHLFHSQSTKEARIKIAKKWAFFSRRSPTLLLQLFFLLSAATFTAG